MRYFFLVDPAGAVLSQVGFSAGEPHPVDGAVWVEAPGGAREYRIEMVDGAPTPIQIVRSDAEILAHAKAALHEAVKARRDQAEWAGCTAAAGIVDTDPDSQRKIVGAVLAAQVQGASFSISWRMADNSLAALDADGMTALGLAVSAHVEACQARKNALDEMIDAASAVEDLDAIDIDAGWPA